MCISRWKTSCLFNIRHGWCHCQYNMWYIVHRWFFWTFDLWDKNIKWGTTEYDQMWFNISKYQLYQYKRKTDQNRASERFLRLTKPGPCQSRARLEWRVAVSAVNHFAIFSPRLPWPSAGRNWIFDTDSHKSMVSIVRPFIGLSHCHAKLCFFYKFKCFNI